MAAWLVAGCDGAERNFAEIGMTSESGSTGSASPTDAPPDLSGSSDSVGTSDPSAPMTSVPGSGSIAVAPEPNQADAGDAGDAAVQSPPDSSSCNACTSGETSCAEGELTVCELQNGCWLWAAPQMCPGGTCENTVNCSTCIDLCSLDTQVCSAGSLQTCELQPNGCNGWSAPSLCPSQECADDTTCFICDDKCMPGEASCIGGELSRCEEDAQGCYDWGAPTACDPATCATETSCAVCDNQCDVSDTSCNAGNLRTCVADAEGCLDWSTATACDTNACGSSSACLTCNNQCSAAGNTSCQGGQFRTCVADSNGCLDWGNASTCPTTAACSSATQCLTCNNKCSMGATSCTNGQIKSCVQDSNGCLDWGANSPCSTGSCSSSSACFVCNDTCMSGDYSCSGSALSACEADNQGCYDYEPQETCSGNTPVCSASNGRCECQSGAAPTCSNSTTASLCTSGAWTNSACSGNKPVCVDGLGCQACTEHSQCPNSACHLAGAKKGTCFATNTVVNVTSAATLLNAVNATVDGGEKVIKLSAATFTMTSALYPKGETAIIGQSNTIVVDNMPFPGDARVGFMGPAAQGITYVSKLQLRNTSADHAGLSLSNGGVMWVDDTKISGEYNGAVTSGELHLRRTSIYGYGGSGATAYYSGSLFVENSMIGPATASYGTTGVGAYSGGVVDIRYSTIVGNYYGVGCSIGNSSGRVGNSIIASNINGYSISDGYNDCSQTYTLVNNAVDQTGYGTKINTYSAAWFVSAANGDLHLSAGGQVAMPTIAAPSTGDPAVDFDGNARPTSGGYPGADQP